MLKKMFALLSVISVLSVGCSTQNPTDSMNDPSSTAQLGDNTLLTDSAQADNMSEEVGVDNFGGGFGNHGEYGQAVTFKVRIENVSTDMTLHLSTGGTAPAPHSPGVWTITRLFNPLFRVGQYDQGLGLEQQAEDGDPSMLAVSMAGNPRVISTGVFSIPVGDASPGPATPGKAFEFMVTAKPGDRLSFTSMFGQSNDLFYAPGVLGIPLFRGWSRHPISGDVTRFIRLWDAGTEVNQEPGVGPDQAPRESAPNTGASEHKRILPVHDQYTYPPTNQVIKVTITPVGDAS